MGFFTTKFEFMTTFWPLGGAKVWKSWIGFNSFWVQKILKFQFHMKWKVHSSFYRSFCIGVDPVLVWFKKKDFLAFPCTILILQRNAYYYYQFLFSKSDILPEAKAKNVHWKWIAIIPIQSLLLHHIILSAVSNFVLQNLKITFFGAKNGDDKRELYLYVFMCKEMTRKTWGSDGLLEQLSIIIII